MPDNGWTPVAEPKGWAPVTEDTRGPIDRTLDAVGDFMKPREAALAADPHGRRRLAGETLTGLRETGAMLRHPLVTAKAFGSSALDAVKAIPDVYRNAHAYEDGTPEGHAISLATSQGFTKGAAAANAGTDSVKDPWKAAGGFLGRVAIPALITKGVMKSGGAAVRLARAAESAGPLIETAGDTAARLQKQNPFTAGPVAAETPAASHIPYRASDPVKIARTVREASVPENAGGRVVPSGQRKSVPPNTNPVAAIDEALKELTAPEPTSAPPPKAAAPVRIKKAAPVITPDELPASWRALVEEPAATKPATTGPRKERFAPDVQAVAEGLTPEADVPMWGTTLTGDAAATDARSTLGAVEAGRLLGKTPAEIRAAAPGPSRWPATKNLAEMDRDYLRRINDERGAIDPKLLRTAGLGAAGAATGAALANDDHKLGGGIVGGLAGMAAANPSTFLKTVQALRVTGMLSGAALPKSALGNVGAGLTAAAEGGSMAPIREMFRFPTNLRNAAEGFKAAGVDKINIPGRAMNALDTATTRGLQRAGLSEAEAQRLLLSKPNPVEGRFGDMIKSPIGKVVMPFQKVPFNTVIEGVNSLKELHPQSGAPMVRKVLTAGAGAAGAAAGTQTDNPMALALIAALMGPRALPFALGAGATAGPQVIARVGAGLPDASWKDLYEPLKPMNHPAFERLFK